MRYGRYGVAIAVIVILFFSVGCGRVRWAHEITPGYASVEAGANVNGGVIREFTVIGPSASWGQGAISTFGAVGKCTTILGKC